MLKNPIKYLAIDHPERGLLDVEVAIVPLAIEHIWKWSTFVQPLVDHYYRQADEKKHPQRLVRADVKWNWWQIASLATLHNSTTRLPQNQSGKAKGLAVVLEGTEMGAFPIGMLTVVPKFYCNAFGAYRSRGFTWFLSDAPTELYTNYLKTDPIRGVATTLVDCSIQTALDDGEDGTLLLHADPNGGQGLLDFYLKRGMNRLPVDGGPISILWRRKNSHEYFHFDSNEAADFCKKNDHRRAQLSLKMASVTS